MRRFISKMLGIRTANAPTRNPEGDPQYAGPMRATPADLGLDVSYPDAQYGGGQLKTKPDDLGLPRSRKAARRKK